ncbi:MAG: UDP-glucose/GDP-mannose dehydrogenase family protein [Polyangiaceae bacterium]|nr:UDP-glucose/GDP-mannose dehydrogenase family protein [Polyangiaceae bacterium]
MKVTVFGTGYVGLVQGAVFADVGHRVLCVDIDEKKIAGLQRGEMPIFEPGLSALVERNRQAGRLSFTTDALQGVAHGQYQFIAVGTPPDEDGSADLKYVLEVAKTIATHMTERKVIVDKSTVPVGTADQVRATINHHLQARDASIPFDVVSNPEFLKEGAAIADCAKPDRIVIGCDNHAVADEMRELYAPFNRNHERTIIMDVRSAELTKYAANCLLATKISFMNEIANLAERLGADVESVRKGIGSDPRIGYDFIYPGCGYGGSCFPKDVQALVKTSEEVGYEAQLLQEDENVKLRQKSILSDKIALHYQGELQGKTFALWGLAFKPNTDDMRAAPARVLMEYLWSQGAKVQAFDPEAMAECQRIYGDRPDLKLLPNKEDAVAGADALVICTEWQPFRAPDFDALKDLLEQPIIFDGRNLYSPSAMKRQGFQYYGIGRGESLTAIR